MGEMENIVDGITGKLKEYDIEPTPQSVDFFMRMAALKNEDLKVLIDSATNRELTKEAELVAGEMTLLDKEARDNILSQIQEKMPAFHALVKIASKKLREKAQ
jgi:hypothetical protein